MLRISPVKMDEDDHEELLTVTDEEESLYSETEDQCLPDNSRLDANKQVFQTYENHTKLEFYIVKFILLLSSTFMIIFLPLYTETMNIKGDAYMMILSINIVTVLLLLSILCSASYLCHSYKHLQFFKPPMGWGKLIEISLTCGLSGFMIIYALDKKRVVCHIQDPVKGVVLIFALLYYFFFCRRFMGLQRIFSTTTIIIGLFISVDYGLCDEFKCRGYDREYPSDDTGTWSWKTHILWTIIYICGLALFSAYFTILEKFIFTPVSNCLSAGIRSTLLNTVSRIVSNNTPSLETNVNAVVPVQKSPSVLHLSLWIHSFTLVLGIFLWWTDFIPGVGGGYSIKEYFGHAMETTACHFSPLEFSKKITNNCANMPLYAWPFFASYIAFSLSSLRFLILSQSAVHTIATMASSLPFVSIWWAVFRMAPLEDGLIEWAPSVSGELICGLLGLPVVILGLWLLCKAHFKDCHTSIQSSQTLIGSFQC